MPGHGPTAVRILDGIDYFVVLARDRLSAAQEALSEGNFDSAYDYAAEAIEKLKPLAFTQNHLAAFADGHRVIRAEDLEVGMVILNWGVIYGIDEKDEPHHPGTCYEISFEGDQEAVHVHSGVELVVQTGA